MEWTYGIASPSELERIWEKNIESNKGDEGCERPLLPWSGPDSDKKGAAAKKYISQCGSPASKGA